MNQKLRRVIFEIVGIFPTLVSVFAVSSIHFWSFVFFLDSGFIGLVDIIFFSTYLFIFIGISVLSILAARTFITFLSSAFIVSRKIACEYRWYRMIRIFVYRQRYYWGRFSITAFISFMFFLAGYIGFSGGAHVLLFIIFICALAVAMTFLVYYLAIRKYIGESGDLDAHIDKYLQKGDPVFVGKARNVKRYLTLCIIIVCMFSVYLARERVEYLKNPDGLVVRSTSGVYCVVSVGSTASGFILYDTVNESALYMTFDNIIRINPKAHDSQCHAEQG